MKNTILSLVLLIAGYSGGIHAQERQAFVSFGSSDKGVALSDERFAAPILIDKYADNGLKQAVSNLASDFARVTGKEPVVHIYGVPAPAAVIVGVLDQSPRLKSLIEAGLIDADVLRGKREKYIIQTVENPQPGIGQAVVIAGSDKRGAIYGVYELSRQIGVSPWHFWADVPVEKHAHITVKPGVYTEGEPAVEYRGIFLNDEAPALTGWVNERFGGYNSRFYIHVFELLQRLKGNFLWPAMWDAAFYDDDPLNSVLADQMGIVIGTSHHEPMARAHKEWRLYGQGAWDYNKNDRVLDRFWREGVERMKNTEDVVTLAMRGDGDEAMSDDTNVALLERIVRNQRKIIEEVTGKPADQTTQVWALYKEVQDYYDNGMRVPDDVTLLLCDDNWGNVRKLPDPNASPRKGGYGMYYHFDYVGGPRSYKWINVSHVSRIWEQMNLCYEYGVRKIWVVNVGDLKPMEYPITFFLDMAWNPERFNETNLFNHMVSFCAEQFGGKYAAESARILNLYTKYNRRVTPELLDQRTYSLEYYDEFRLVTEDYYRLATEALRLYHLMPEDRRDAFDQLVLYPTQATANLYEMYYAAAMNHALHEKHDPQANVWAERVKACFERDSVLTHHYNQVMSGGKWNHFMDQTRIGYTSWNDPKVNRMPAVYSVDESGPVPPVFMEADGYVSIEAQNYTRKNERNVRWIVIPDLSRTDAGVTTAPATEMPDSDTWLEYEMELATAGEVTLELRFSPTLNFNGNRGLRYAVSFDGGPEQIVNINGHYRGELAQWQREYAIHSATVHPIAEPGRHTLRFRPLEPGLVLQKITVDTGGLKPSFLGPRQSEISNL